MPAQRYLHGAFAMISLFLAYQQKERRKLITCKLCADVCWAAHYFLLGAYGGHLFALKKKKAWIFLLMGILGMEIIPLFLYTSGISFADAFMACFIEKDENGYIEIEDYPYWI